MRGRFLTRLDADSLREHVEGDRLLSSFEFKRDYSTEDNACSAKSSPRLDR